MKPEPKNQTLKSRFIEEIKKRNLNLRCSVCSQNDLIVEGPFSKAIQESPGSVVIGGPSIPTMAVICKNCGSIRDFALGSLGLLDELSQKPNNGNEN